MFKSKTVIVIGAGAGVEIGMPLGSDLSLKIGSLLRAPPDLDHHARSASSQIYNIFVDLHQRDWDHQLLTKAAAHVSGAMEMAQSIDTFLESFAGDRAREMVGKLGIAKAILDAEAASKLRPNHVKRQAFAMKGVADTWLVSLAQLLFSGLAAADMGRAFENVAFINFNYDRCLEVFLVRALKVYFEATEAEAQALVRGATILHPYGRLGSVFDGDDGRLVFAEERPDLLAAAGRLRTYTESFTEVDLLHQIQHEYGSADTLIFLGFAFHDQNMRVLSEPRRKDSAAAADRVYATTMGVSESDVEIIRAQVGLSLRGRPPRADDNYIRTFSGPCRKLFDYYWRSLSA